VASLSQDEIIKKKEKEKRGEDANELLAYLIDNRIHITRRRMAYVNNKLFCCWWVSV
jgi:hypothetical protein